MSGHRRQVIESWLESIDEFGRDEGQWMPLRENFEWVLKLALKGLDAAAPEAMAQEGTEPAIRPTCEAANAFWRYWRRNGDTHVHGYYESTWGAINAALRTSGVVQHRYGLTLEDMLNSGRDS